MKSRLGTFGLRVLPLVAAVALGAWLARSAADNKKERDELTQMKGLASEGRLLAEAVWENIDALRARALDFQQLRVANPKQTPSGPILHWAELEMKDGQATLVRQAVQNPAWKGDGDYYLRSAIEQLGVHEINEQGVTALRIREDSLRAREWLALGFKSTSPLPSIVLVLINPEEAFPVFKRLARKFHGTATRAAFGRPAAGTSGTSVAAVAR